MLNWKINILQHSHPLLNKDSYLICPVCGNKSLHLNSIHEIETIDDKLGGELFALHLRSTCGSYMKFSFERRNTFTRAFVNLIESCQYVYFIHAIENNQIKIGRSKNPEQRLKQLSTGSCVELKLIGKVPGGHNLERQLHLRFTHLRSNQEWFQATEELIDYIQMLLNNKFLG